MSATNNLPGSQSGSLTDNKISEIGDDPNAYSDAPSTLHGSDEEKGAPPAPPSFPGSDAPDGGLTAWLVVLCTFCTAFCSFGWLNSAYLSAKYSM